MNVSEAHGIVWRVVDLLRSHGMETSMCARLTGALLAGKLHMSRRPSQNASQSDSDVLEQPQRLRDETIRIVNEIGLADVIGNVFSTLDDRVLREIERLVGEIDLSELQYDEKSSFIAQLIATVSPDSAGISTPPEIARLMVALLDPKPLRHLLDPACGTAGLLMEAYAYIKTNDPKNTIKLTGVERNAPIGTLGKMNLLLNDISPDHLTIRDVFTQLDFCAY
jgi:hypothetical protein